MERRSRRFLFSSVPVDPPNSMSTDAEEPSSLSSGGMEDMEEARTSSRSHKHLLESLDFGSGSNLSSIEGGSDEWVCRHYDELFLNNSSGLAGSSRSNESISNYNYHGLIPEHLLPSNSFERGLGVWCNSSYDGVRCWPPTRENTSATQLCFAELHGIQYDSSRNVSRLCELGGVWQKTDYSPCVPLMSQNQQEPEDTSDLGVTIHVYFFGYCISLAALIVAMFIFLAFKRQMPWSTSKARKWFHPTETAEQMSMGLSLSDRHSVLLGEPRKLNLPIDLEYKTESIPVTGLTTLLFGNVISSSMPELTTLELVKQEELHIDLAQIAESLYKLRHARTRQLTQFKSGRHKLSSYANGVKLLRISNSLTSLRSPEVSERMLTSMTNSYFADVEGFSREAWKLRNYPEWKLMTCLTFGCILGNAFQCQTILSGFKPNEHMSRIAYQLGNHVGVLLKANLDVKAIQRIENGSHFVDSETLMDLLPVNILMEEVPDLFNEIKVSKFPLHLIIQEMKSNPRVQSRTGRIVQNARETALSTLNSIELENTDRSTNGRKLLRELRCLRNKIHIQLIVSYVLAAALWIITKTNFSTMSTTISPKDSLSISSQVSCATFILLHYYHLTNFFWMFVEGLYLYVLVVQTFTSGNIRLRVYTFIGWGLPFLVVTCWLIAKWLTKPTVPDNKVPAETELNLSCIWVAENVFDWFYKVPALLVLIANIGFLFQIMWVLITKLRSATNPETQQSRKAAKALVVLIPLLGLTYVLVLAGPRKFPAYEHIRALLISTQGFLVALIYCFLNGEVRTVLRHRWSRIRSSGCPFNLGRCCGWDTGRGRHLQQVRDLSPNCRTESIRLYTPAPEDPRKRESTTSELTTMTSLNNSSLVGGSLNGINSGIQPPLSAAAVKRLSALSTSLNGSPGYHIVPAPAELNLNV